MHLITSEERVKELFHKVNELIFTSKTLRLSMWQKILSWTNSKGEYISTARLHFSMKGRSVLDLLRAIQLRRNACDEYNPAK